MWEAPRASSTRDARPNWEALTARLRQTHKAKRKFIEVLDGIENRRLVD
jgi:hypothetical protein